jgi:hypothetical protein
MSNARSVSPSPRPSLPLSPPIDVSTADCAMSSRRELPLLVEDVDGEEPRRTRDPRGGLHVIADVDSPIPPRHAFVVLVCWCSSSSGNSGRRRRACLAKYVRRSTLSSSSCRCRDWCIVCHCCRVIGDRHVIAASSSTASLRCHRARAARWARQSNEHRHACRWRREKDLLQRRC